MFDDRTIDEFVSETNNQFRNFGHSDSDLSDALKGMEQRGDVFENPDPFTSDPEYVKHVGFDFLPDLDSYIEDLKNEARRIRTYWEQKSKDLQELSEEIDRRYANYRNGASRDLDPDIDALEADYLRGLEEQEQDLNRINEINNKISELLEARKRWLSDIKDRTAYTRKKKNELLEQLERAKKELKDLMVRKYNGEDTPFVNDRIAELEDIINNIEEQLKQFHTSAGYKPPKNTDKNQKVNVIFDLNGGALSDTSLTDILFPMELEKGQIITDHYTVDTPYLDDDHEFDCWTLDGEPFDLSTPVENNIELKAQYKEKKRVFHTVTYCDSKGNVVETLDVEDGELAPELDGSIIKKQKFFKEFKCWEYVNEEGEEVPFDFASQPITSDIELYPSYKLSKQKVLGAALAVAASGLAIGVDAARKTTNLFAVPWASAGLATLNTSLAIKLGRDTKKGRTPDYEAERNATGIKKAVLKLRNKFRNPEHKDLLRYYLNTSSTISLAGTAALGGHSLYKFLTQPTPIPTHIPTPIPTHIPTHIPEQVEYFNGVEAGEPIYTDPAGLHQNGHPLMQWFNRELHYYLPDGSEIVPGVTPLKEISGQLIKIVEVQDDGRLVNMGYQVAKQAVETMAR